jgi:mercuric ion transport protein
LLLLGVSGAWIGNLTRLEPYRMYFISGALAALAVTGRRIFRPARHCEPGQVCALAETRRVYKVSFVIVSVLVLVALLYRFFVRFFY